MNGKAAPHLNRKEQLMTEELRVVKNQKDTVFSSFLLDSELNLYEHQSTYNPNMPLRDLVYISKQLEKYTRESTIYSTTLVKIPVPRFVVFYNGTDAQPDRQILRLSDAYEKEMAEPELELKVLMLNINFGHNKDLMEKCRTLREYSQYVDRVRRYAKQMQIEDAVERAVMECIREGILADFLSSQRAEVIAVSIFEYNEEEEMKKIRASEYKHGKEDGISQGMELGIEGIVVTCKELGVSFEQTVEKVKLHFNISEQAAQEKVLKYWK